MIRTLSNALEWAVVQVHRIRVHRQFRQSMGFYGDFENPRSHQEKTQFRKIYGNHRFYARMADKYRVREYVAGRVGEKYLISLLGVYDRLEPRHFDALPNRFVIKANHGCKWHQIVRDKRSLDVEATCRRFNRYLKRTYGGPSGERHFSFIEPKIIIEELLERDTGGCPWDYCFFCYNTPTGFDYAYSIVAPDGRAASFTKEGELLVSQIPADELKPHLQPVNFSRMVQVARAISAEFDFVCVDLYNVGQRIYFGGITCTPQQGYDLIKEPRRQRMRDEMWQLDAHNRRLYRAPRSFGRGSLVSDLAQHVQPAMESTLR